MNKNALYISVAGLLVEHVREVAEFYEALAAKCGERTAQQETPELFLGLQTSRKFLNGEKVNPLYVSRMNTIEQIQEACNKVQNVAFSNIVAHYNPSGGYTLPGVEDHLKALACTSVDGIQFNGFSTHQSVEVSSIMSTIDTEARGIHCILQIGDKNDYENPATFAKHIKCFSFLKPTHLLLDGSGGKGIPIDEEKAIDWIKAYTKENIEGAITMSSGSDNGCGLVVSGGFGPDNTDVFRRIKNAAGIKYPLSIDAEGKLRDNNVFSVEKTKKFLTEILKCYD